MRIEDKILNSLQQTHPFRFVDDIIAIDNDTITGSYTFKDNEYFYKGHFKGNPVTPGVILIECMAQIALSCHGAYFLLKDDPDEERSYKQFFTSSQVQFIKAVYPGEKITVSAKKVYFRHGKIKSQVKMTNDSGDLICKGELSGIVFNEN